MVESKVKAIQGNERRRYDPLARFAEQSEGKEDHPEVQEEAEVVDSHLSGGE